MRGSISREQILGVWVFQLVACCLARLMWNSAPSRQFMQALDVMSPDPIPLHLTPREENPMLFVRTNGSICCVPMTEAPVLWWSGAVMLSSSGVSLVYLDMVQLRWQGPYQQTSNLNT